MGLFGFGRGLITGPPPGGAPVGGDRRAFPGP